MRLKNIVNEEIKKYSLSKNLEYHLNKGYCLTESVFRLGSDAHDELMCEVRNLYEENLIEIIDKDDLFIMEKTDGGKKGVHDGKTVTLDSPKRNTTNPDKKFIVYVSTGKKNKDGKTKAKKIEWGHPDYEIKNDDPEASKSFRARHKCSEKTDRTKAGWWACNVHRYHKQLGLSSSKPW